MKWSFLNVRSLSSKFMALFVVAAIMLPASAVCAQGTFGALPDPISSRDLTRYSERLGLSDHQTMVFAEHHAAYLEEFRELRERDIEAFLDAIRGMRAQFDLGDRRLVEDLVRTLNRIMGRIRMLDEGLFDKISPMLTEAQSGILPRVRQARERERFNSEVTRFLDFLNPGVRVDLSEIITGLEFAPEQIQLIDPILMSYEQRLTTSSRKLFETTTSMVLDVLKRLEQMGFTQGSLRDPATAFRLFEAFQTIWDEVTLDLMKESNEIASLHRRTYRSIAAALPEDSARRLTREYYRRAYPEAANIGRLAERQLNAALRIDTLPEDTRQSIELLRTSHRASQDRVAEQIVDLLDERRRSMTLRTIIRRGADERQTMLDDLRRRGEETDASTIQSLQAMLGPELAQYVQNAPGDDRREFFGGRVNVAVSRAEGTGGGGPVIVSQRFDVAQGMDPTGLPRRITITDVRHYADRWQLDESQRSILQTLYDDYAAQQRKIQDEQITPLNEAMREAFRQGGGPGGGGMAAMQEISQMREAAFNALTQLEKTFFDDVEIAVIGPEQQQELRRVRAERERAIYLAGGRVGMMMGGGPGMMAFGGGASNEAGIDLTRLLFDAEIASQHRQAVLDVLDGYSDQATSLLKSRFEAEQGMRRAMERFAPPPGSSPDAAREIAMERGREIGQVMQTYGRTMREATDAMTELNRRTLDSLAERLPQAEATSLRRAFERQAYPEVFNDPGSLEPRLAAIFELPDLSESQRTRIMELAADYRRSYSQVSDRMIEVHAAGGGNQAAGGPQRGGQPGARGGDGRGQRGQGGRMGGMAPGGGAEQWQAREEQRNALERLRFERTELNERALRQLRSVLTPSQVEQIGGLDPVDERRFNFNRRELR